MRYWDVGVAGTIVCSMVVIGLDIGGLGGVKDLDHGINGFALVFLRTWLSGRRYAPNLKGWRVQHRRNRIKIRRNKSSISLAWLKRGINARCADFHRLLSAYSESEFTGTPFKRAL